MIKVHGIDELILSFTGISKDYPNLAKKFLDREGTKLKKAVQKEMNNSVRKRTGNLYNSVTKQKPYTYYRTNRTRTTDSVKVYGRKSGENTMSKRKKAKGQANNKGYHTHLIERGHDKVLWGNRTADVVRGFYMYRNAGKKYEVEFERNCDVFVDKILGLLD